MQKLARTALVATLFGVAATAMAADVGQHPAIFVARSLPGIDATTFIVGHPAGGASRSVHANHPHPALATHLAGSVPHIDSDRYLVQPPATTRWAHAEAAPLVSATRQ